MKSGLCIYFSERGKPLIYRDKPLDKPVLTVENYVKWYNAYLIMPDGSVKKINNYLEWIDHTILPRSVLMFCDKNDIYLDEVSFNIIIGRYIWDNGLESELKDDIIGDE